MAITRKVRESYIQVRESDGKVRESDIPPRILRSVLTCDYGSELIMVSIIYLVNITIYMRCDHYDYTHCIAHNNSKILNSIYINVVDQYKFDFIEWFTTTFLHTHSWLKWVDEDEVGLTEKLTTRS